MDGDDSRHHVTSIRGLWAGFHPASYCAHHPRTPGSLVLSEPQVLSQCLSTFHCFYFKKALGAHSGMDWVLSFWLAELDTGSVTHISYVTWASRPPKPQEVSNCPCWDGTNVHFGLTQLKPLCLPVDVPSWSLGCPVALALTFLWNVTQCPRPCHPKQDCDLRPHTHIDVLFRI